MKLLVKHVIVFYPVVLYSNGVSNPWGYPYIHVFPDFSILGIPTLSLWIQTLPEKIRTTAQIIPQSHFLRRYGWIHRYRIIDIP